ncbi:hypothetical protein MIZ03_0843 [Rhodoferax lithotrophicus]|uniref:Uncharacterized protein n=1 Tax=Rhodoferax lithotrophicus TaxID=2798804 RepID=A0ABM7MII4_9BURK|nr:hypothetical protein MIZ03_0843 [Rhodoferax sp. MIZ03]
MRGSIKHLFLLHFVNPLGVVPGAQRKEVALFGKHRVVAIHQT